MNTQEQALKLLCKQIESAVGREIHTPKDFEFLSERVFDKQRQTISPTTLKRLWGYIPTSVRPRLSSLNVLAQFLDYPSWKEFCKQHGFEHIEEQAQETDMSATTTESDQTSTPNDEKGRHNRSFRILLVASLAIIAVLISLFTYYYASSYAFKTQTASDSTATNKLILKQGQLFADYEDYHRLFGISETFMPWAVTVPHHPFIIIWTPEYKNSRWHNHGDSALMFPTITEEWDPGDVSQENIKLRNRDNYYNAKRIGEVRITFMKNLVDSSTVFLGIYRMDKIHSDTTHVVWERIAEECDLNCLDYIEELRN